MKRFLPRALTTRLVLTAVALVAVVGVLVGMAATLAMRGYLYDKKDGEVRDVLARATLAVGPAVGRGSDTFATGFKLTGSRTKGSSVVLTLRPRDSGEFVLSALYDGPVIFATC